MIALARYFITDIVIAVLVLERQERNRFDRRVVTITREVKVDENLEGRRKLATVQKVAQAGNRLRLQFLD